MKHEDNCCLSHCCQNKLCFKKLRNRRVEFCCRGGSVADFYEAQSHFSGINAVEESRLFDNFTSNIEMRRTSEIMEENYNLKEPPALQFYDISQESLLFLDSLKMINKPIVEFPQLPRLEKFNQKTLVLDLDETLVHSSLHYSPDADVQLQLSVPEVGPQTIYVKLRPYLTQFLSYAANRFEIVVFTASPALYANKLLDMIDPSHYLIDHRLFRSQCYYHQGHYVKDLAVLGRNLEKMAIVDNSIEAMGFNLHNGILIDDFFGDPSDQCLVELIRFLDMLEELDDARDAVDQYYKSIE